MATREIPFRYRKGRLRNLPNLDIAEPVFTTDTGDLYIGSSSGNQRFINAYNMSRFITMRPILSDEVPTNSFFVDSIDGKMKFKDGDGKSHALYEI